MPTLVMEKVLKFSLNKQNFKSIQAEVTAKSVNNHGKEALLDIIQKITASNQFLNLENHITLSGPDLQVFCSSYICFKDLKKTEISLQADKQAHIFMIECSFWSLFGTLMSHPQLKCIIDIVTLAAENKGTALSHIKIASFALKYTPPIYIGKRASHERVAPLFTKPDTFSIRLVALDYTLLPLIDQKYLHFPTTDCLSNDTNHRQCRCPTLAKHTSPRDNILADLIFSWVDERRTEDLYELEEIFQENLHNSEGDNYKPWVF
jgi:hypothetical protein